MSLSHARGPAASPSAFSTVEIATPWKQRKALRQLCPHSALTCAVRADQMAGLEDVDETGLLQNIAPLIDDTNNVSARQGATPAVEQDVTSGAENNTPSFIRQPPRRTRRQRKQQRRGTATTDDPPAMSLEHAPWPHRHKISTATFGLHVACVAKPMPKKEIAGNKRALDAMNDEWDRLIMGKV